METPVLTEEDKISKTVIEYTDFESCDEGNIEVSEIEIVDVVASAHMFCNCGPECDTRCDYDLIRINSEWAVEDKEYYCEIS